MKISEIKLNINMTIIIIIILGLLLLFGGAWTYHRDIVKEKDKIILDEIKLRNALTAEVKKYENKENEWVSEKKTLQSTLKKLGGLYDDLNDTQRELLKRLNNVEKGQTTIAAALIDVEASITDLKHTGDVDIDDEKHTILFSDIKDDVEYKFLVGEVNRAFPLVKPTFLIQTLRIPNRQGVEFFWENDRKEGYPVSFKITNSNPYINVLNMESYVIPMNKEEIDPTRWDRIMQWTDKNKKSLIGVGTATLIGVGLGVFVF